MAIGGIMWRMARGTNLCGGDYVKTRKQVNIRLNAYIDDLLNTVADKTNLSKTDIINLGIERVAIDVLGADLVNEIRLQQFKMKGKEINL